MVNVDRLFHIDSCPMEKLVNFKWRLNSKQMAENINRKAKYLIHALAGVAQ